MRDFDDAIENGVHLGDCLELLLRVRRNWVDMVIADLPYGTTQNKWDSPIDLEALWAKLDIVCAPYAVMAFTASQPFTSALVMSKPKWFKHEWIWIKNRGSNYGNTVREPMKEHESVLIFARGQWTYNRQMQPRTGGGLSRVQYGFEKDAPERTENYGEFAYKRPAQLGEMRVPSSWQKFNTEVGLHPTQKPVALYEYLIRTYTNDGMLILDPCAGSGTTAIAAKNVGNRRYICMEKDPDYFETISKRLTPDIFKLTSPQESGSSGSARGATRETHKD
jgi:site-specific DNA-methyltransferase (adenine-specific)